MNVVVEPLGDRVIAKRVEAESVTKSGLILPEVARERPQEAIVVAVGPGKPILTLAAQDERTGNYYWPSTGSAVVVGDRILVGKYVGNEVAINNELFLILREEEILGIVREQEEVPA